MIKSTIIPMTPNEITTDGFLRIREAGQPMTLKFQPAPDFRGKLIQVEWNLPDDVVHVINANDEAFKLFQQVGERPEIEVSANWLESLEIPKNALIRIKFRFETFRREPVWYAHLCIQSIYGDMAEDADSPYLVKK